MERTDEHPTLERLAEQIEADPAAIKDLVRTLLGKAVLPELLTIGEVARQSSVSTPTARAWIADGRLVGVNLDGSELLRVRREDFLAFLESWSPVRGPIRPRRNLRGVA